jgi:phosphatidylglycerol:prolipoprotein diacylglycerol transferase
VLPYLHWGSWQISTYALCYALMYGVLGIYGFKRLQRLEVAPNLTARIVLLFLFGVFIGSQVNVIANSYSYWVRGVWVRAGHISAIWGLMGGVGVATWAFHYWNVPFGKGFDSGCLPIPLGQAIGRLGCLAAGCCGGSRAPANWGFFMPDDHGIWLYRYPTQPLSAAIDLLIFFILLVLDRLPVGSRFRPFNGFLLVIYVILFSAKRFVVEFLRADYRPVVGPFSIAHLITLIMFGCSVSVWIYRIRRREVAPATMSQW